MKRAYSTVLIVLSLLFASASVSAQEMSVRKGIVTGISPIQVQSQKTSGGSATGGALGRMFGRALGRAAAKAAGEYSYEAYEVGSSVGRDVAANAGGNGGQQATAYMVMIKFDDGDESAIQSAQISNLRIGGRVRVFGSGSSAQIVAE